MSEIVKDEINDDFTNKKYWGSNNTYPNEDINKLLMEIGINDD